MKYYSKSKNPPLTEEEIKEKYKDIKEELQEVLKWKKEEEAKLEDNNASPQKKGAAKRALKKVARRIDTVKGQIIYWKLRIKGESHFKSNLEKNEYWASCSEKAEKEKREKDALLSVPLIAEYGGKEDLPNLLKKKL